MRKNPQDTTLRNVRAANKKIAELDKRVKKIELALVDAWRVVERVKALERQVNGKGGR